MSERRDVLELAENYTVAWCSGDPGRVASFYAEDGRLQINGGEPSVGREAITEAARAFMVELPDLVVRLDAVRSAGDTVIYLWTLEGTNDGPGGTGRRLQVSGFEVWRLAADGRIASSSGHFDADEYERQRAG